MSAAGIWWNRVYISLCIYPSEGGGRERSLGQSPLQVAHAVSALCVGGPGVALGKTRGLRVGLAGLAGGVAARVAVLRGGGEGSNSGLPSMTAGGAAGLRAGCWVGRVLVTGFSGETDCGGRSAGRLEWLWLRRGVLERGNGCGVLGSRTNMYSVRLRPMCSAATTVIMSSVVMLVVVMGRRLRLWHSAMEFGESSRAGGRLAEASSSGQGAQEGIGRGPLGW